MGLPVIFLHEGKQKYLEHVIRLAEERNENVYLIGDESNQTYTDKWYSNRSFDLKRFENFSKSYAHMSSNSYEFELTCFIKILFAAGVYGFKENG